MQRFVLLIMFLLAAILVLMFFSRGSAEKPITEQYCVEHYSTATLRDVPAGCLKFFQ